MRKYYCNWNRQSDFGGLGPANGIIILAVNEYHAAIRAIPRLLDYSYVIGSSLRLSERGHGLHSDDIYIETELIIKLCILANNYVEETNV